MTPSRNSNRVPLGQSGGSVRRYIIEGCPHCDGWHRDEPCSTGMCTEFVEIDGDSWAGTYCKLLAGHDGPCSPHYPEAN